MESDVEKFAAQRLCYECEYMELYYDGAEVCLLPPARVISHWEIADVEDMSKGKLRECLQKAATCPDFKAVVVRPTLKDRYEQQKVASCGK